MEIKLTRKLEAENKQHFCPYPEKITSCVLSRFDMDSKDHMYIYEVKVEVGKKPVQHEIGTNTGGKRRGKGVEVIGM